MPKSSKEQIDADEKKVIKVLQSNAKEGIDVIAKKCRFSRQKVWRIIKRLEKNKTIWGYCAVVDDDKLDRKRYMMLIKRSNEPIGDALNKIIDLTMHSKGKDVGVDIICSSYLHGEYDWVFMFTASSIKNAKRFSELVASEYKNVISEISLLEDIFSVTKSHIVNPNIERFKDFF